MRELFAHLFEGKAFHDALVSAGKIHDVWELGRGHFARAIEQRLSTLDCARTIPATERAAIAQAFAGALLSLVSSWIARGMKESPAQMDELYHRLFWSGVSASG